MECQDNSFYVLARQGKSKNVGVWELETLAQSNMQLEEFSPDRKLEDKDYKLPEGGVRGSKGLKAQSILVHPRDF